MLFGEIVAVYFENHTKHISKHRSVYSSHCDLKRYQSEKKHLLSYDYIFITKNVLTVFIQTGLLHYLQTHFLVRPTLYVHNLFLNLHQVGKSPTSNVYLILQPQITSNFWFRTSFPVFEIIPLLLNVIFAVVSCSECNTIHCIRFICCTFHGHLHGVL